MRIQTQAKPDFSTVETFFAPRGVAVIGASPKEDNQGRRIIESLQTHQFPGPVVAVHPKSLPLPNCPVVQRVEDLPDFIDLAILAVSSQNVLNLIEPLSRKKIQHIVVVGGGFAETGKDGKVIQEKLKENGKRFGVRILGPNCLGTFSSKDHFNSFFLSSDQLKLPGQGSIGIISQSGAFLSMLLNGLAEREVGVHRAINFGNRIDIGECEALEAFANDPEIQVIGMYLESFQDGARFFRLAQEVCQTKPVLIYKGGKREAGIRAAQAHSAALSGSYDVFQAVCQQAGMLEVFDLNGLINGLYFFSLAPKLQGNRLLIVSNGGGMGVLLSDLCDSFWDIKEPSVETQTSLYQQLPRYYSFKNPVDLTGSGKNSECGLAIKTLIDSKTFDGLLLVLLPGTSGINGSVASELNSLLPRNFPVAIGACGSLYKELSSRLNSEIFPIFSTGEDAARTMNQLAQRRALLLERNISDQEDTLEEYDSSPITEWINNLKEAPGEMEIKSQLAECGLAVPESCSIKKEQDIDDTLIKINFPLVLKVSDKDVLHKAQIRGVKLNLGSREELETEWKKMNQLWPGKIWIEQQMPPGLDLMVGFKRDSDFGPVLLIGTGGSHVEVYRDIERACLPVNNSDLARIINQTKAGKIIEGTSNSPSLNINQLIRVVQFFAKWFENAPKLQFLEFNPVRLYTNRLVILDAKLKMNSC
ncbi:MAG: hypothetical protein G3M70_06745 [Candidatus Nitronauta litoralis]|uniref:CoA-binding domain-containing protein n=1 Tax=Candidatus Nitronauta litoralis TaxID=2705533 RepID=A0A7T0BVF3_9BACT|nr:MAG: hypothetical protein G3M70_06745 [Candidatus Nitronauta litoralis]